MNDIVYDVIIVGGGAAGVMAALELGAITNITVALLEKAKRLNDARNIGYCWLGASARSHARLIADPAIGGSGYTDAEFAQFLEFMNHFHGSELKFKTGKIKKKTIELLAEHKVQSAMHPTCTVTEDGFIRIADRMHMVLRKNINIIHKVELAGVSKVTENGEEIFVIETNDFTYRCRKLIVGTGRSSQSWWESVPKSFNVPFTANSYEFGVRLEMPTIFLERDLGKDFEAKLYLGENREWSLSTPIRKMNVETEEVGPLKISNSRQSSHGKKTYVSMALTHNIDSATPSADAERLVGLSNILNDEQLSREPASKYIQGTSTLSPIPEFAAFAAPLKELTKIMPLSLARTNVYTPEAKLNIRKYAVNPDGSTEVSGFYMIGDMTGHQRSFVQAAISGLKAANSIVAGLPAQKIKKKEVYDYATIEAVRGTKKTGKALRAAIRQDSIRGAGIEAEGGWSDEDAGDD